MDPGGLGNMFAGASGCQIVYSPARHCNPVAFFFLTGNNRTALNDATAARKLQPTYMKAILRGGFVDLC